VLRQGSQRDSLRAAGLAHLLEHMAFKGTARVGALDFQRESAILDTLDEGARQLAHNPVVNLTDVKRVGHLCRCHHRCVAFEPSSVGKPSLPARARGSLSSGGCPPRPASTLSATGGGQVQYSTTRKQPGPRATSSERHR